MIIEHLSNEIRERFDTKNLISHLHSGKSSSVIACGESISFDIGLSYGITIMVLGDDIYLKLARDSVPMRGFEPIDLANRLGSDIDNIKMSITMSMRDIVLSRKYEINNPSSIDILFSDIEIIVSSIAEVVNLKNNSYDVYIGRVNGIVTDPPNKGCFGNPFTVKEYGRRESIERFVVYFYDRIEEDSKFKDAVLTLRGKKLGCYCRPLECHGDVIVQWLNENMMKT